MTKSESLERLALAVKTRRGELGLAQGALAYRGGPSVVTVGQLERAQMENPQSLTLSRLDRALDWPPGRAARILAGEEHPTSDGGLDEPVKPVGLGLDAEANGLPQEDIDAVIAQVRALKRARGLA